MRAKCATQSWDYSQDTDGDGIADREDEDPETAWWDIHSNDGSTTNTGDDTTNDDDDTYGNDTSGGDTTPDPPNPTQPEKVPCLDDRDTRGNAALSLYNQPAFAANFAALGTQAKTVGAGESSFILKQNGGVYSSTAITAGGAATSGNIDVTINTPGAVAEAHNHTSDPNNRSCFSDKDMFALANVNVDADNFKTIYVVGKDATYAMVVTNSTRLYDISMQYVGQINGNTGSFYPSTEPRKDYDKAYNALIDKGFSDEDANAQAKAYMYEKCNMGVSLLKAEKDSAGNVIGFKELNTTITEKDGKVTDVKATKCQ